MTGPYLTSLAGSADLFADVKAVRAGGIADASCAVIARLAAAEVPRYAIGLVNAEGRVSVVDMGVKDEASFLAGQVLLTNPLGVRDNWSEASRWFRRHIGKNGHRAALAALSSEQRRDYVEIDAALREHGPNAPAMVIPSSEVFSKERAAEVSYIFDVPSETLRAWKKRYRSERAGRKPGAPKQNR
jgi:hypothetical protein